MILSEVYKWTFQLEQKGLKVLFRLLVVLQTFVKDLKLSVFPATIPVKANSFCCDM